MLEIDQFEITFKILRRFYKTNNNINSVELNFYIVHPVRKKIIEKVLIDNQYKTIPEPLKNECSSCQLFFAGDTSYISKTYWLNIINSDSGKTYLL